MKAVVSPFGHNIQGSWPFTPFDTRVDAVANGGVTGGDVLVLWGGTDIHPSFYKAKAHPSNQVVGQDVPSKRDEIEWFLIKKAVHYGIPIIGVCRGAQMLCAFANGSLFQHVSGHNTSHSITTFDQKEFKPQADHHQMMDLNGTDHQLLAWSTKKQSNYYDKEVYFRHNIDQAPDFEPEVVLFPGIKALAIQPHPEWEPNDSPFVKWVNSVIENKLL